MAAHAAMANAIFNASRIQQRRIPIIMACDDCLRVIGAWVSMENFMAPRKWSMTAYRMPKNSGLIRMRENAFITYSGIEAIKAVMPINRNVPA